MFNHYHYVPVLKWKRGEQKGLENCAIDVKKNITPLIELQPIQWNFEKDCPSQTINEHIIDVSSTIEKSWGKDYPFFLDIEQVDPEVTLFGDHIFTQLSHDSITAGLKIIPVISFNSSDAYLNALINSNIVHDSGICLRINLDHLSDESLFETRSKTLFGRLKTILNNVDLIIDLGYVTEHLPLVTLTAIINNFIYDVQEWRTITIISTSMPIDMSDIERNAIEGLNRIEWQMWQSLYARFISKKLDRMPTFGDYTISNPEITEIDPRTMNPSGNIRYTIENEYLIVKGTAVRNTIRNGIIVKRGQGYAQMKELCRTLISKPDFSGPVFSWGDQYIEDCANGRVSTGNPETWRRVGTNHHLTFVSNQIAKFCDS